jgi:hypothetical protein
VSQTLQRPWAQQPSQPVPIDRGNTLTRGLRFAMMPAANAFIDATGRAGGLLSSSAGTPPTAYVHRPGRGLKFTAGALQIFSNSHPSGNFAGELTLAVLCIADDVTGGGPGQNYIFGSGDGGVTTGQGALAVIASNTKMTWGVGGIGLQGSTTLVSGVPMMIMGVRSGSSGAWSGKLYLNGKQDASVSSVSVNPGAQQVLALGSFGLSATYYFVGKIFIACAWDRPLNASEAMDFYRNPWQIFATRSHVFPPQPAAVAGGFFSRWYYEMIGQAPHV